MTAKSSRTTALTFRPVTSSTWSDFETLFEATGGPKYCWCMVWRAIDNRAAATNDDKKDAMHSRVVRKTPVGLLAYLDREPAGWCSIAPRETHIRLSPEQDDSEENIWSLTCFFIPSAHREQGLGRALLDAAIAHAFSKGAFAIEAYPVDPGSPSYRFMGFKTMFAERGFVETGRAGTRRHVMRLTRP